MSNNKRNNLDKALAQFIEALRLFIPLEMEKEFGKLWDQEYFECLTDKQKSDWEDQIKRGKDTSSLIDFHNLGIFAIKQKRFLKKFFGRDASNLPTKFNEIADARNMFAHYGEWDNDKAESAFLHMLGIAKSLSMTELEEEIRNLKDNKSVEEQIADVQRTVDPVKPALTAWFNNVKPHLDIRQGNLDESVFAADLA